MIIIEDSVPAQSFGWVTVPLKATNNVFFHAQMPIICIPVAFEAIPVERGAGNLPLSGTVHIHAQFIITI